MNSILLKSAMNVELDDVEECNYLITQSKVHSRSPTVQNDMHSTSVRKSDRLGKHGLFCNNHKNQTCTECLLYCFFCKIPYQMESSQLRAKFFHNKQERQWCIRHRRMLNFTRINLMER